MEFQRWGGYEFGRRLGLKAAGAMAASGALLTLGGVSDAYAASKSQTIKIGFVSPRTGSLADFAGPDAYVLDQIRSRVTSPRASLLAKRSTGLRSLRRTPNHWGTSPSRSPKS